VPQVWGRGQIVSELGSWAAAEGTSLQRPASRVALGSRQRGERCHGSAPLITTAAGNWHAVTTAPCVHSSSCKGGWQPAPSDKMWGGGARQCTRAVPGCLPALKLACCAPLVLAAHCASGACALGTAVSGCRVAWIAITGSVTLLPQSGCHPPEPAAQCPRCGVSCCPGL
jgi:hypothetical protein